MKTSDPEKKNIWHNPGIDRDNAVINFCRCGFRRRSIERFQRLGTYRDCTKHETGCYVLRSDNRLQRVSMSKIREERIPKWGKYDSLIIYIMFDLSHHFRCLQCLSFFRIPSCLDLFRSPCVVFCFPPPLSESRNV